MDSDVIGKKLESLVRCLKRIESRMPVSAAALAENIDSQDIIVLNLERAVQTSVDIASHILPDYESTTPATMADTFRVMANYQLLPADLADRMAKAVGFRNIAVHQYQNIDWTIVFAIITKNLVDFRQFAASILKLL